MSKDVNINVKKCNFSVESDKPEKEVMLDSEIGELFIKELDKIFDKLENKE